MRKTRRAGRKREKKEEGGEKVGMITGEGKRGRRRERLEKLYTGGVRRLDPGAGSWGRRCR